MLIICSCSEKKEAVTEIENIQNTNIIEINDSDSKINFADILQSNILFVDQNKIDELTKKFDENSLTSEDKAFIKECYNDIINFGAILYPEASIVLNAYLYGNGDDVIIKSGYFFKSPVIQNALINGKGKKLIGPVRMNINDDPRIAYTVNGFYIKNDNENIEIYQHIEFGEKDNKDAYTMLYIPFGINKSIKLPHRLIRIFEEDGACKAFTVRIING
jgi:hypothetical protein